MENETTSETIPVTTISSNTTEDTFPNYAVCVEKAISEILPSEDPLDAPDFNMIDYINTLFPTEQSLSQIDEIVARFEQKSLEIDADIASAIQEQIAASDEGQRSLEAAQRLIRDLFVHVRDIKERAERSEELVREITRDIKQLDSAKRNLTLSITTLQHLHMLVEGVETVKNFVQKRSYGEIVLPLQAITEVMHHFEHYLDIPQIKALNDDVTQLREQLAVQITQDFKAAFSASTSNTSSGGSSSSGAPSMRHLTNACLVAAHLHAHVKRDLLAWFTALQLQEYTHLFEPTEECAWLDRIDKRYAWLKRHLLEFEDKLAAIFPPDWLVAERIAVEFCTRTRCQLTAIMQQRTAELDCKLLLFAIQKTAAFETLLARKFTGATLAAAAASGATTTPKEDRLKSGGFHRLIGSCFVGHLTVYVDSVDRSLRELIERFARNERQQQQQQQILHRQQPQQTVSEASDGVTPSILASCPDLFVFYKKTLIQCCQLDSGPTLLRLCYTFQKYLHEYADKVLLACLPSTSTQATATTEGGFQRLSTTGLIQNFSALMLTKESSSSSSSLSFGGGAAEVASVSVQPRLTSAEVVRCCCILSTAEYSLETIAQLCEKLKEKIDSNLVDQIDMSKELDTFHKVISTCIQVLVQDLESACEPALTAMSKIQWQHIDSVGDQSAYITAITTHLKSTVPPIREHLMHARKYFTQFCVQFASRFTPKFVQTIYKCKPINTEGAEQLLLDTHMLKTTLLNLPTIASDIQRQPPVAYTKIVTKTMTKAEMLLKVVMTPTEPSRHFVEQFRKLLPDGQLAEFHKCLDMKGVKRQEQTVLLDTFKNWK